MTEFFPPMSERETEELIEIAHSTEGEYQDEAVNQATAELSRRGVSKKQQQKVVNTWKEIDAKNQLEESERLQKNEHIGYSVLQMFFIFFSSPMIVTRGIGDMSLSELKRENYKKRFRQRLFLLIMGVLFWISVLTIYLNMEEQKHINEIENVDISAWERSYYGEDSISTSVNEDSSIIAAPK